MAFLIGAVIFGFVGWSDAAETVSGGSNHVAASKSYSLPACVDQPDVVQAITETLKAERLERDKYKIYKKHLSSDSPTEAMARLIYAETVGANCPNLHKAIAPLIAQVIANRVRRRAGQAPSPDRVRQQVLGVVYQYNQFASSLNPYAESRYRDFLCPRDLKLWTAAMAEAEFLINGGTRGLSADTMNYFLYQHSPRFKKEPWTLQQDTSAPALPVQSCVRFFKVPNWK